MDPQDLLQLVDADQAIVGVIILVGGYVSGIVGHSITGLLKRLAVKINWKPGRKVIQPLSALVCIALAGTTLAMLGIIPWQGVVIAIGFAWLVAETKGKAEEETPA